MDNDNYYQSYHQGPGGPPPPMKHSPAPGSYPRSRPMPIGGGPISQPLHSSYPGNSVDVGYNSRAPATGPPPRKPLMDSSGPAGSGLPPPLLRDYQYDGMKESYFDGIVNC